MAGERERRVNAGTKMAQMLQEEDCDDFYQSTYGGFFEEEDDEAFDSPAASESDSVDSDFDIDENDEPVSDDEQATPTRRRKPFHAAGVYKEPEMVKEKETDVDAEKKKRKSTEDVSFSLKFTSHKRKLRKSTVQLSKKLSRHPPAPGQTKSGSKSQHVKLSQQELLKEAQETEKLNLKSLEHFRQSELEDKKNRQRLHKRKGKIDGSAVKYLSLTMPACEKSSEPTIWDAMNQMMTDGSQTSTQNSASETKEKSVCRNFLVFSEPETAKDYFAPGKRRPKRSEVCVVTGEPAKYRDPVTGLPYADAAAFKRLRLAYEKFLETPANKKNPEVAKWLAART